MVEGLFSQIAFADQAEVFLEQQLGGEHRVVHAEGDGRTRGGPEKGVKVMNVDLRGQERGAKGDQGLAAALGEFDGEQFHFTEGETCGAQGLPRGVGMGIDQPDEGGIGQFLDGKSDDAAFFFFEGTDEGLKAADAVFEKDGELPHRGWLETSPLLSLGWQNLFHGEQGSRPAAVLPEKRKRPATYGRASKYAIRRT